MASAWGKSWGKSWGNSWGRQDAEQFHPVGKGVLRAFPIEWVEAQRREQLTQDDVLLLLAGSVAAHLVRH